MSAENDALRKENESLSQQVDWLMEQMRLAKKKAFGASSEKSHEELTGQMNFLLWLSLFVSQTNVDFYDVTTALAQPGRRAPQEI
ncbi:MAG: transposase [Oscillospiraceae bacterium]